MSYPMFMVSICISMLLTAVVSAEELTCEPTEQGVDVRQANAFLQVEFNAHASNHQAAPRPKHGEHDSNDAGPGKHSHEFNPLQMDILCYLKNNLHRYYKILDPQGKVPEVLNGRPSCAVVSNSGALLARSYGAEIDSHQVIFRFNTAPTRGFEQYVGSRTDFRLGFKFPADCPIEVCYTFPTHRTFHGKASAQDLLNIFPKSTKRPFWNQTEHLTTGFHGMLQALSFCGSVDAYEMVPSKAADKYRYHYWERDNDGGQGKWAGPSAEHNYWHGYADAEHKLWKTISTTPEDTIDDTGKSSYVAFDDMNCHKVSVSLASLNPETKSLLNMLEEAMQA